MDEKQIEVFRNQLSSGTSLSGSLLPKLLDGLTPQELAQLRSKALEGHLGIELERLKMQDRLSASQTEIDAFISTVARLERQTNSPFASYKADFSAKGASGETTITSKKGCFVATAIYADARHPNVCLLRTFRHSFLETFPQGRNFSAWYYRNGEALSRSPIGRGFLGKAIRVGLLCLCASLRLSSPLWKRK
jgi:hypothetical protein